jgi:hypothetical protein
VDSESVTDFSVTFGKETAVVFLKNLNFFIFLLKFNIIYMF